MIHYEAFINVTISKNIMPNFPEFGYYFFINLPP